MQHTHTHEYLYQSKRLTFEARKAKSLTSSSYSKPDKTVHLSEKIYQFS